MPPDKSDGRFVAATGTRRLRMSMVFVRRKSMSRSAAARSTMEGSGSSKGSVSILRSSDNYDDRRSMEEAVAVGGGITMKGKADTIVVPPTPSLRHPEDGGRGGPQAKRNWLGMRQQGLTVEMPRGRSSRVDRMILEAIATGKWVPASSDSNEGASIQLGTCRPDARRRPLPGCHPDHSYECLVFKGGGAKGSIYPGAVRALEDAGIMPYIKRYAGASAGAVTAALLAIGLSSSELYRELAKTDMQALVMDGENKIKEGRNLFSKFGLHPGIALYRHLGLLFYKYVGCADVTFKQVRAPRQSATELSSGCVCGAPLVGSECPRQLPISHSMTHPLQTLRSSHHIPLLAHPSPRTSLSSHIHLLAHPSPRAQLYDLYGVELAIVVTNVSRASVELLHVKTAPNYPIRKAVRASMSLPIVLQPCRDRTIRSLVAHRHSNSSAFERVVKKKSLTSTMNRHVSKQTGVPPPTLLALSHTAARLL